MKEKRTTKLYEGLSNKQKAALTLHYLAELDATEVERIRSAVPWKEYRCIDAEYTNWRDGFVYITVAWGLMYWKERYILACAAHELIRMDLKAADVDALKAFEEAEEAAWKILARVVALEAALEDVCSEHGLNADDVINAVHVPVKKWPSCEPDADYREEVKRDLLECLPDAEPKRQPDA